jgi:hypothetical protein
VDEEEGVEGEAQADCKPTGLFLPLLDSRLTARGPKKEGLGLVGWRRETPRCSTQA